MNNKSSISRTGYVQDLLKKLQRYTTILLLIFNGHETEIKQIKLEEKCEPKKRDQNRQKKKIVS